MAITISQVTKALDADGVKYVKADDTTVLIGFGSDAGRINVMLSLWEDGEYLDLRTMRLATCLADNPSLERLQAELLKQNFEYKMIKFSRDPADGEIVGSTCLPIEDNKSLATDQMGALIAGLVGRCQEALPEINKMLASGGKGSAKSKPKSSAEPRSVQEPKSIQTPSRTPEPTQQSGKSVSQMALAAGVLLIGISAILAVVYLFIHKG